MPAKYLINEKRYLLTILVAHVEQSVACVSLCVCVDNNFRTK